MKKLKRSQPLWPRIMLSTVVLSGLAACDVGGDSDNDRRQGIWQQNGYGRIWQFDDKTLTIYSRNAGGCLRESQEDLTALYRTGQFMTTVKKNEMTVSGPAAKSYRLQRLDSLPSNCEKPLNGNQDNLINFDFFWHSMNENYAFFAKHDIDWSAVYQTQRPRIAAASSMEEITAIYEEIITSFPDAHVGFSLDRETLFFGSAQTKGLQQEWLKNSYFSIDDESNFDKFLALQMSTVDELLLPQSRKASANIPGLDPAIVWGQLTGNVGYLRINRLSSLRQQFDELSLKESLSGLNDDLNYIDELMPEILRSFAENKGVIIDMRFNFGGADQVGLRIASQFNDSTHEIANSHTKATTEAESIVLFAANKPYKKPLYVLTGGSTASAAEVMTLALQSLPQAKLIGESTHGIFSDVLTVSLPNGGIFGLSNEIYRDNNGDIPEGQGVQPLHVMPAYASFDLQAGVPTPLAFALQQFDSAGAMLSTETLRLTLEQIRQTANITGISAAVIRDDKIVFEDGVGLADVGHQIMMTSNTPVSLASISKTFIGTHLMQQVESNKVNLDTPLSTAIMDLSVDNPLANRLQPTLRQLATHTSGIVDDPLLYVCQYFVEADGSSLYANLMSDTNPCSDAPITRLEQYLPAYLSQEGRLYKPANFISAPGEQWAYSNIASALAGYAIETQTGVALPVSMKQQIFAPLAMNNTSWSRAELNEVTPARLYTRLLNDDPNSAATEVPHYGYPDIYSGGLWSSAHDLATYLNAIMHGGEINGARILSEASVQPLLSQQTTLSPHEKQGLFWLQIGSFYGHTGGDVGTTTWMFYNPYTKVGFVLLFNQDNVEQADRETGFLKPEQPLFDIMTALYRFGLGH